MKHVIKDEELIDFLDGNLTTEETSSLKQRMDENGELELLYHLRLAQKAMFDQMEKEEERADTVKTAIEVPLRTGKSTGSTILVLNPMRLAAAKTDGYLCDIECEEYILLSMGISVTSKSLLDEAYHNKWMKEKGMPIYYIGRLLEKNCLSVARRYESDIDDMVRLLDAGNSLIAVVNAKVLTGYEQTGEADPNHAVVVLEVRKNEDSVVLFDPQTGNSSDNYSLEKFARAWAESQNFLVIANSQDKFTYEPQPINVDDVELNPELIELGEAIAENAHEVWAMKRREEGWTWGQERNDSKKETPVMVPYSNLPESEKDYDRELAMQTLKLVKKIGYRIVKDS